VNRGYVYCSDFISDEDAERELRSKNPGIGPTRVVKFVSGRYRNIWVKNVVAIGNASGFVEPLEATALGVIAIQSWILADSLVDSDRHVRPTQIATYNSYHSRNWESVRSFIAVHYKFNTRLDTPFWRECREKTDLAGAEPAVEIYRENGPSGFWGPTVFDPVDQFKAGGYAALLVGQRVPYRKTYEPTARDLQQWKALRQKHAAAAAKAMSVAETLAAVRAGNLR
jgi:tryptophan halogenase